MRIFLTGATGFVGQEILRQLTASGHTARVLVRNPRRDKLQCDLPGLKAEIHTGDILDPCSLAGALANIDAVIHIVGIISEAGANTFERVHTGGTRNIVSAAQKAGVRRFVHMSALGVRPNAASRYHQSKWAAEEIVRQSGLTWTIFRPSIIYGPDDLFVNLFARMSRFSPILPVMGSGASKLQPIPVEDVAECFVGSLTEPRSFGQIYDLCGPERLSFVQVLDTILAVTRRRRLKLHIPMAVARLQAALLESVFPKLLRKPSPLNRDQLLMLQEDNIGNPEPANQLFGLKQVSFRDGIARYLTKTTGRPNKT